MADPAGTLLRKLSFVFSCVLLGTLFLLVTVSAATADTGSGYNSLGDAVRENVSHFGQTIGGGLSSITVAFDRIAITTNKATDLNSFIRPADYVEVPVIATFTATPPARATAIQPATSTPTPAPALPPPVVNLSTANLYAAGNCTWWAAHRRAETNHPIPNSWGNAVTWASRAAQSGFTVDHHPATGAIMQTPNAARGLGHVAFVEGVDSDGTWHISEMNVRGLGVVNRAPMPAATAANYNFIH